MTVAANAGYCPDLERPSAIGEAYVAAWESLRRFISKFGANAADVEDIAQEALACAMQAECNRLIENPRAYLFRVAQNLALRNRNSRIRGIIEDIDDLELEEIPSDTPSVEEQVISRERLGQFVDALATLPPVCRRVFVMRKVYGHSHREIAEWMGISVSTVEKHLAKGFARCVAILEADNGDRDHCPARAADSAAPR